MTRTQPAMLEGNLHDPALPFINNVYNLPSTVHAVCISMPPWVFQQKPHSWLQSATTI
ncbi:hypothetical protein ACHAW6_000785 [Cyclotella cf. meneghiniana]